MRLVVAREDRGDEMSEAVVGQAKTQAGEKVQLTIHKGIDAELDLAGLRFVACRREIEGVDGGVTLNVRGSVEGEERDLVRFDFFRKRPHYHVPAENQSEAVIDGKRFGDGLGWGITQMTTRMKALVEQAGFEAVAAAIDPAALADAGPRLRALVEGLAEPSETSHFEIDASVLAGLVDLMAGDED
jgi:hypothetical protein